MNRLLITGLGALLLGLASCTASPTRIDDHWNAASTSPRIARYFLSFDPNEDGDSYRDFQWKQKKDINLTIRRHFFNHNPDNPFQKEAPELYEPRPNHSLLPDPWNYIHLEGFAWGAISLAAGGAFVPVPVGSVLGTLEEGGMDEFMDGLGVTVRPLGVMTASFLNNTIGKDGPVVALLTSIAD